MEENEVTGILSNLVGSVVLETREDQKKFATLASSLSRSTFDPKAGAITAQSPAFERSDLFSEARIPSSGKKWISKINNDFTSRGDGATYKVFRREVPVRDPLLAQSVPQWSAGAAVDHTIGPFLSRDGRRFWYDFFLIEKLIALYVANDPEPALLFKVREGNILNAGIDLPATAKPSKTYRLIKGSIWINSKYLAVNAPANTYSGLQISGGQVTTDANPQQIQGKLTVAPSANITVDINLAQQPGVSENEESAFGSDARNSSLQLPDHFRFHFSGNGRTIDEVGPAGWSIYGRELRFEWLQNGQATYDAPLQRIIFPFQASEDELEIQELTSPFNMVKGRAPIDESGWALTVTSINVVDPLPAAGTGEMMVRTNAGISEQWKALQGGTFSMAAPVFLASPGQITVAEKSMANPHLQQSFQLWKDESNSYGNRLSLRFPAASGFLYITNANGSEILVTTASAEVKVDRPVKVDGYPPLVRTSDSLIVLAATETVKSIYLLDFNLIADAAQLDNDPDRRPESMAFALTNALFKVTEPNSCFLYGELNDDFQKIRKGGCFLGFGLLNYIPTLPDPYAAKIPYCREDNPLIYDRAAGAAGLNQSLKGILISQILWDKIDDESEDDDTSVSFHIAPVTSRFMCVPLDQPRQDQPPASFPEEPKLATFAKSAVVVGENNEPLPDFDGWWENETYRYGRDIFALLDVSSNADLLGVSFDILNRRDYRVKSAVNAAGENISTLFPIQVEGMDVVSTGTNVKVFTVPQISWEPVFNLSPPAPPPDGPIPGDPEGGFNYYPDDGGPTHILNNSEDTVSIAPLPLSDFLFEKRKNDEDFQAYSFFTLPFGLKAVALLSQKYQYEENSRPGGNLTRDVLAFPNNMTSGLQLRMDAGEALREGDTDMFMGSTVQINNILDLTGNETGNSTLGGSVTTIFNREFFYDSNNPPFELLKQRGVPVTRMDLSGYGANMFSNWLNANAAIAETSQAKFDVVLGRCSHEIIQVKSIMYPWAVRVVRTITLFRVASGYVYRYDTGWRAESEGKFNFRYFVYKKQNGKLVPEERFADFQIHPGMINGLYNVSNIIETKEIEPFKEPALFPFKLDTEGVPVPGSVSLDVILQPVYFDADISIDNLTAGGVKKATSEGEKEVVPSKRIVGFVQLAPRGMPLSSVALKQLVLRQGTIGGEIDCEVDLVGSHQKMRFSRFDFNNSFGADGTSPVFSVAGRGTVLLPREGSWTLVKHERSTGEVTPVPANLSVPVIREGKLIPDGAGVKLEKTTDTVLTRIAEPAELLRQPAPGTLNYGFVQSTDTQKVLFLTPSFKLNVTRLLSKTPPLFVDAFRIVNTKSIFPNIAEAENFAGQEVGEAILMKKGGSFPFSVSNLKDAGKDVYELMDIRDKINGVAQQGLNLLHNPEEAFDLPTEFNLIDLGDNFRIYIEYDKKDKNGTVQQPGSLDFDINSVAESWKSKMNNIGLVVDLAGISRLMTIRGNWDSEKGKESTYPEPDITFSPKLQPLIDLLEILESLQGGDYGDAVKKGLKLAMSNKAGSWEYKFEASKEIPVLRFPVPDFVYNDPNTPFKLEAGLKIGAYFNAALKVTTDTNELLPSAGGELGFYARLSVMCVSISAATIYAIGQANVDIAADTKGAPSLHMKFGFGAQIVVGLPVVGNVSVLYMVGAEIFIAGGDVAVSAFLLFEGHAEILGGIVSITIRIEAKGTYIRKQLPGGARTDLQCQVTFGIDISIAFVINIHFKKSWQEQRQIA